MTEGSAKIGLQQALEVFENNLDDIKEALASNIIVDLNNRQPFTGPWPADDLNELVVEKITADRTRVIKRIVSYQQSKASPQRGKITDADIEQARNYPIAEMFEQLTGQQPRHNMVKCPFHDDNQASMSLAKHNRYKCFACDESGDVISLYMKLQGVNFIQAVKKLI